MSRYIKINNWSGPDFEDSVLRIAKVFRMDRGEADSILREVSQGNPWQFQWTVPDEQADLARNYLIRLGFNLEVIEADRVDGPRSAPAAEAALQEGKSRPSWFASLFKKSKEPGTETPKTKEAKSLFSFFGKSRKENGAPVTPPIMEERAVRETLAAPDNMFEPETPQKKSFFSLSFGKNKKAVPEETPEPPASPPAEEAPPKKSLFGFLKKK